MNTANIFDVLSQDHMTNNHFFAVCARNEFKEQFLSNEGIYIFNTHYSYQPGEHWIGVIRTKSEINYFDSTGRDPSTYPDVAQILKLSGIKLIKWNDVLLQGFLSTTCGDYCLLFAIFWSRGCSIEDFLTVMLKISEKDTRDHVVRKTILDRYDWNGKISKSLNNEENEGIDNVHIQGTSQIVKLLEELT